MALCFPTVLLSLHPQHGRISSKPRRWRLSAPLQAANHTITVKWAERHWETSVYLGTLMKTQRHVHSHCEYVVAHSAKCKWSTILCNDAGLTHLNYITSYLHCNQCWSAGSTADTPLAEWQVSFPFKKWLIHCFKVQNNHRKYSPIFLSQHQFWFFLRYAATLHSTWPTLCRCLCIEVSPYQILYLDPHKLPCIPILSWTTSPPFSNTPAQYLLCLLACVCISSHWKGFSTLIPL